MSMCLRQEEMNTVIPELKFRSDHSVPNLNVHDVVLRGCRVLLRPMTEGDWDYLMRWNNDPDVMELADQGEFQEAQLSDIQAIYRWISTHAHCFIIEVGGRPIGDCWLQRMNLKRIVDRFPGEDIRRIDLAIGEKELWGNGYGTETIGLLVNFGFHIEDIDAIFAIVSSDNGRSLRAFQKCGFKRHDLIRLEDGDSEYDLVLQRTDLADDYINISA